MSKYPWKVTVKYSTLYNPTVYVSEGNYSTFEECKAIAISIQKQCEYKRLVHISIKKEDR